MTEQVKKRRKLFFFADCIIKLYDNGYLGYYKQKDNQLKALVSPSDIKSVALESGNTRDKLKVVTKNKTYLFKFGTHDVAKEWHTRLL